MRIAIVVSQITPGGGLSKYICTLTDILTKDTYNQVYVVTTHQSEVNPELEILVSTRGVQYLSLETLSTIKKYFALASLLRKLSPDVVINNYNATTQYILPFLPKQTKIVHIIHGITDDFYRVASINGKYVDKWVIPTPALEKEFNAYTKLKYKDRIVTIPHAVDESSTEIYKKGSDIVQLTFIGVLYDHKGVLILPDVIKRLACKRYKFHFTFIGDGVLRKELETALKEEVSKGVVDFTGRIDSKEVYQKLQQTDIFVYPTHLDSFGLVIAEAMMNGAVPVVTCLKGITDTIVDFGINGYLETLDDVDGFVEHISYLIENDEKRKQMSQSSIEKAKTCFSKEVMKRNYKDMLSSL